MSTTAATAAIADFIVNTSAAQFPAGSEEKAVKVIADTYAVILAGVSSEVAEPLQRYLESMRESRRRLATAGVQPLVSCRGCKSRHPL